MPTVTPLLPRCKERTWQPVRRHVASGWALKSRVEFTMRFSVFIEENLDAIVAEWEAFARTLLPAAKTLSDLTLRDHCREILLAIVKDMETSQTEDERDAKSKQVTFAPAASATIAAAHGALRHWRVSNLRKWSVSFVLCERVSCRSGGDQRKPARLFRRSKRLPA